MPRITYWSTLDLVSGSGTQRGYFLNEYEDADTDSGSFEGKVSTTAKEVTLRPFSLPVPPEYFQVPSTGNGTCEGRLTSPTQVEMTWDGAYQLASKAGR